MSPLNPFELPPYASAMAICFAKAKSSPSNRILTADIFSTPSTTFELLCYVAGLANLLAEALSPPPSPIQPFNKLVEDYVDIETEEGNDSNRHGSPSC